MALAETERSSAAAASVEPDATSSGDAEEHFTVGSRAFEKGDATTALLHMRRAFALKPRNSVGGNGRLFSFFYVHKLLQCF
jgi:hypothetical protein